MRHMPKTLTLLTLLAGTTGFYGAAAWSEVTPEDQRLIEAAGCNEIVKEYRNFSAAEKKLAEDIRLTDNSTTAGNVAGAASLAVFGLGFFSWDDQADAKENLAELTEYRKAIAAEGKKKGCNLPGL